MLCVCKWSVCKMRGYDPVPLKSSESYQEVLSLGAQNQPHCQTPRVLPPGRAKTRPQFWAGGSKFRCLMCFFPLSVLWKLLSEEGSSLWPPQRVPGCLLGLFISFSTMQECSEPIALQLHHQGSLFIFLGGKLRELAPLGTRGFFVALPQTLIVFTCVSMPVWSSVLAATAKSSMWGKGSQKSSSQGAVIWFGLVQSRNFQGHGSSSCTTSSVPTLHEKTVQAAGKVAWLISCCHPSLAPSWATVQGSAWEIWSRRCPQSGWPCGLRRTQLPGQLDPAAHSIKPVLHLRPKPSHTCLDIGLRAHHQCGNGANLRRGLSGESHPWGDTYSLETGLAPAVGLGEQQLFQKVFLQCSGTPSIWTVSTAAPKMLPPSPFRRRLKVPLDSSVHLRHSETTHKYPC